MMNGQDSNISMIQDHNQAFVKQDLKYAGGYENISAAAYMRVR